MDSLTTKSKEIRLEASEALAERLDSSLIDLVQIDVYFEDILRSFLIATLRPKKYYPDIYQTIQVISDCSEYWCEIQLPPGYLRPKYPSQFYASIISLYLDFCRKSKFPVEGDKEFSILLRHSDPDKDLFLKPELLKGELK